jgi:hypothetical protein
MSISKPKTVEPVRPVCPVCGKTAYSQGGIHPQCAVTQADKVAREKRSASLGVETKPQSRKQWTKRCPRCRRDVAARRFTCDCGHNFQPAVGQ